MKISLIIVALLGTAELWALGPTDIANKTVRINMENVLAARTDMYQEAAQPWFLLTGITDFVVDFPANAEYTTTTTRIGRITNEVQVSYAPAPAINKAYINVNCNEFRILVILTYTSNTEGTATITWHEAGDTRHFRNMTFTVQSDADKTAGVELPEEIIARDPEMWDDGLQAILSEIESASYRSDAEKLYRKRLVSLLPMVMMVHDSSFTNPDYKGNTALHYACGLSHVKLVQWLVEHGADLEARTDKGASIDACISGKNSKKIKAILEEARKWRDRPYSGPEVDIQAAREAAAWLELEFSGINQESPDYTIPTDEQKARTCAQLLYRSVKSGTGPLALGMSMTDTPAILLSRVQNAKMSEEMFVENMLRELKQCYIYCQHVRRRDGLVLAKLPHMILAREEEGMPPDAATAVYRAAREGNVELVRWLTGYGADRRLMNEQGEIVTLPPDTPNLAEIQEALNMHD